MGIEKDGTVTCDTCGEPIEDPKHGMLVWEGRAYDEETHRIESEAPMSVEIVHKGSCDRGNSAGIFSSWWQLDEFLNPEGFARWVNDRFKEFLPEENNLLKLIDSMWPLIVRSATPKERRQWQDHLEWGMWYGKPVCKVDQKRRTMRKEKPELSA
jgi:hypothetical protein